MKTQTEPPSAADFKPYRIQKEGRRGDLLFLFIGSLKLLQGDLSADLLQLSLSSLGISLGSAGLDNAGSTVKHFLNFLQAGTGKGTQSLQNVHSLLADFGQLNVKFGLLFSFLSGAGSGYNNAGSSGYAKFSFAGLNQFVQFQYG